MNATWWSNSSGNWQQFASNETSFANNTNITQTNTNLSEPGKTYYWSVNLSDGHNGWNNETYHFTTNYEPTQSSPTPADGSTGITTQPTCNITVSDTDGETLDVYFYENTTENWVLQQTNNSVDVTTPTNVIWNKYSNASAGNTKYWWSVNITDGCNWTNATYDFTTQAANTAPTISNFETIIEGDNDYDLDNDNVSINWTVTDSESNDLWLLFNYSAGGTPGIPTNDSYQGKIAVTSGGSPGYNENDYNLVWTDSSGWVDTIDNINITFRVYDGSLYSEFWNSTNNITGIDGTNPTDLSIYDISEDTQPEYLHFNGTSGIYYSNAGTGDRNFTVYVEASDATSGLSKATFPATVSTGGDDTTDAGGDYEYTYQYTATGDGETFDGSATVTVYDIAGNSATVNFDVLLDDTNPTFDSFSLDSDTDSDGGDDINPDTGWYDDLTIQGDFSGCTDAKSGIANYSIQTGSDGLGTPDTDGTDVGCTAAGEGLNQNINYNISDNVGNRISGDTTADVNIDTTPPSSPDAMTAYSETGDTDEVYADITNNKFYFSNSFDSSATVNFTGNFTDSNKWKADFSSFGADDPAVDTNEDYTGEYTIDDSDSSGTITFYGYDQAGNNANDTITCTEDATTPSISITSEEENSIYLYKDYGSTQQGYYGSGMAGLQSYWINGSASDATGINTVKDDTDFGDDPSNTGTNESWVFNYTIDSADNGDINITFTATDYVGNTGTTWYQFYEDNENPVSGLTDIPASISDLDNINGTATDNVSVDWVKIYIKNTTANPDTYWTGSSWTDSITWVGASANDSNYDSNSEGWNVDTTSITWSDGSSYEVNATSYDIVNNTNYSTDSFTISQEYNPLASYYTGIKNTYGGKQTNDWKTNHTDADGSSDVNDCYLRVGEDGGDNFTLAYNVDNNSYWIKDGNSYVISIDNVYNNSITNGYTVIWNFTLDWDFPFDDSDFDVAAYTDDEDGDNSGYNWTEGGTTTHEKDLIIYSITEYTLNNSAYSNDGDTTLSEGEWFRGGVQVKCSGVVTYEGTTNIYPPTTAVDVHFWADGSDQGEDYDDDTLGASGQFETNYYTTTDASGTDADYDFNVSLSEFTTGASQGTGGATTLRNASRDNEEPDTTTLIDVLDGNTGPNSIWGTSTDSTSLAGNYGGESAACQITIKDDDNNNYWTGSSWSALTWIDCSANDSTWDGTSEDWNNDTSSVNWGEGVNYTISAKAIDHVGNVDSTLLTDSFRTAYPPVIITNASTGVEETNATLRGYLKDDGLESCTVGLRYGTSSGSYNENYSIAGTHNSGYGFSNNNDSLTSGDLYYFQAWGNNTIGFSAGSELTFFTKPPAVTSLTESSSTNTTLTYTWTEATVGTGATAYTRIQYQTGSNPTTVSEGTNTYNGTDETDNTGSLMPGTHYYFSAFSWGTEGGIGNWNDTYVTMDAWTNPGDPTNAAANNASSWINITWTHGTNGEYTMIRRNSSGSPSYPADRTSGDQVVNTTNQYINDTGLKSETTYYYKLWTWDTDGNKWCDTNLTINGTTTAVVNNPPTQTGEAPTNTSTNICPIPNLHVICNDTDAGDSLTATWRSNSSNSWVTFATNSSISPGTNITQTNTNFSNPGTTYYWSVNLTDGTDWNNQTYSFTTNYEPTQSGESPTDTLTDICPIPSLHVVCSDSDSDEMTATWWSNSSTSWVQFATNNSISSGNNITQTNTNFSSSGTTYYWSVNLTDGCNWTNTTYSFTTNYAPTQTGETPTNTSTGHCSVTDLYAICSDTDSDTMTATWRSNSSGTWQDFGTNSTISTGTNITQSNNNFTQAGTRYYWSLNLTDGCTWTNNTYSFTTNQEPTQTGEAPSNTATGICIPVTTYITPNDADGATGSMTITWRSNSSGSWNTYGTSSNIDPGSNTSMANTNFSQPGTKYYWSANITDSCGNWSNQTYSFTTNYEPAQSGENPADGSIGVSAQPTCNITISDTDGGTLDVYFYENTTGSFVLQQTNTSVDVTTPTNVVWNSYTNASAGSTKYWWSVNITDNCGNWSNQTYSFTTQQTNQSPSQSNEGPINASTNIDVCPATITLNVTCTDPEADTMTATWKSNSSGTWQTFATNNSISNNTNIIQTNTNFSNYSTTYYWSVNLTDGNDNWDNKTYHFTTQNISTSVDTITPYEHTSSPLQINATGDTCLDNVTLWYRYSPDNSTWWNSSFTYRKKITLDKDKVFTTLTNFPILVSITDSDLASKAQSDGDDIVFTNITGSKLNHEIEKYTSGTGELVAWVNIPSLSSSTDTEIYMYYGNSTCDGQENIAGTWNSNYLLVQHMDQSSGNIIDSTSNNNDLTKSGSPTYQSTGKVGYSIEFDGSSDYFSESIDFSSYTAGTLEAWVKPDNPTSEDYVLDYYVNTNNRVSLHMSQNDLILYLKSGGNEEINIQPEQSVTSDIWYYHVGTLGSGGAELFSNGSSIGTDSTTDCFDDLGSGEVFIGQLGSDSAYWDGDIDEVRISKIKRNDSWINTTYNTIHDNSNFITTSTEEKWMVACGTNPDTSTPWSWSFDFDNHNGSGYYEFYSIGDKDGSSTETAPNTADAICYYLNDTVPYVENVTITSPYNFTLDDLTGSGDYIDNQSDAESGSSYEWYESEDNSTWTALGVNSTTLDSNYTNEDYYYKFEYTPKNSKGTGTPVNSSVLQITSLNENAGTYSDIYNEDGNLTIANGGVLTISGSTDFSGNITVETGGELNLVNQDHEFGSLTINNNANFTSTSGTLTIISEKSNNYALDIDGNFTHNSGIIRVNTSTTSNIDINSQNGNLYNLYINSGSAYITSNAVSTIDNKITVQTGTFVITSDLTTSEMQVDSGANFNINSTSTFTMSSTLTLNGAFNLYDGEAININLSSTLFNLTNAQDISLHNTPNKPSNPSGYGNVSEYVNISSLGGGATVDINISYSDSNLGDILENTLTIWEYNWSTGIWSEASTTGVNTTTNWVWANSVTTFSPFAPLGSENFAPTVTNPDPSNGASGISINKDTVSALINDSDGDTMDWTIEVSNTGDTNSSNNVGNGTIECNLTTPLSNSVTYTWYVNVTDGYHWTNETFTFTTVAANKGVISKGQNAYSLELNPTGETIYGYINGNTVSTPTDTNWHYVVMTYDGSQIKLYVDGALQDNTSYSGSINTNNDNLVLGEAFTGTLDELRVSNTDRSAAWINTSFYNTNSPTTFATFGTQIGILSTWSYRKQVWINSSMVDSTLTNFPVLVSSTDTDLKNNAHSTGNDIIFMDTTTDWTSSGITSRYAHEIEKWDSSNGEIVAWINVDSISSTSNTTFYIYYGNSICTANRENASGVWDSNYVGVWHLNDTPSNGGTHYDSTSNNHHLTFHDTDGDSNTNLNGIIDGADELNGDSDYMDKSYNSDFDLGSFTLESWVSSDDKTSSHMIINKQIDDYADRNFALFSNSTTGNPVISFRNSGGGNETVTGTSDLISSGWHYVAATNDGSNLKLYINGSSEGSDSVASNPLTQSAPIMIGRENSSSNPNYWDGKIDELRISKISRNDNWINTTYNTIAYPSSFISFGSQEIPNVAPTQSSPSPSNGATGQSLNPTLSIQVNDTNIDSMNVTFRTNASGVWTTIGYNDSVHNGTYSQTPSNMNSYNTKYYWSVNLTDYTLWSNQTYSLTTNSLPQITGESPTNGSSGVSTQPLCNVTVSDSDGGTLDVYFYENSSGWSLQQTNTSVDVTTPTNVVWDNYSNASAGSTKYWWSVNVSDGISWINETYHFTTSASPYIYGFYQDDYKFISDFIPDATSKEKEYTHILEITDQTDIVENKILLKITEELKETTYLDRIYLRLDKEEIIEIDDIKNIELFSKEKCKNLLNNSDDKYLILEKGDENYLEFILPDKNYEKIEFVSEGYYIKHENKELNFKNQDYFLNPFLKVKKLQALN